MTLGFLAALCPLELMTGVLVLPQRQAVLVAKQAAHLDLLTGGRFVLGVGTGWNDLEYRALDMDFATRAERFDEQLEVIRRLWAEPVVTFKGRWHDLDAVGLLPRPASGRIPIWMGANPSGPGLRRIARTGDGWLCRHPPDEAVRAALAELTTGAVEAGRDPRDITVQAMVQPPGQRLSVNQAVAAAERWLDLGVRRVSFGGMRAGRSPAEHLDHVGELAEVVNRLGR